MARKRNALNPAKVKADLIALDAAPPQELFRPALILRRRLSVLLMAVLSAFLLSVSFAPFDRWYLAYVALVPWVAALEAGTQKRWPWCCCWVAGALFWAANLYWLWWVTLVGYFALVFYMSLYWLAAAMILRASLRRGWPMWIVLPVIWVSLEYLRNYTISGFPWFFLAHSQYRQTRLIQISDLTGQYGVSFFVAMVNGSLVDLLIGPLFKRSDSGPRMKWQGVIGVGASAAVACSLLGYGTWRMGQQTKTPGPVIGLVQEAIPITLGGRGLSGEATLQRHMQASEASFAGKGCQLVVWPESMLPLGLNREVLDARLDALSEPELRGLAAMFAGKEAVQGESAESLKDFLERVIYRGGRMRDGNEFPSIENQAETVAQLSSRLQCPILAGGTTIHANSVRVDENDYWSYRNSALWFDRDRLPVAEYSKMHLVPFSEYVPFKNSWLWFHRCLRWFVPDVMSQLAPGDKPQRFELAGKDDAGNLRKWRIVSPICYEGTFDRVCRKLVMLDGNKSADIIVNISNDGWFVCPMSDGRYLGTTEQSQHLAFYCFRAVENRLPVVRAVNTGISASIDSDGRIVAEVGHMGARTMIAGTLLLDGQRRNEREYLSGHGPKVLVDKRISGYSLVGDVFALAVSVAAVGILAGLILRRSVVKKGQT